MAEKARQEQGADQATLMALFRAIASHDSAQATRLLRANHHLATAAVEVGATRAEPTPYYFETIGHYAYAGDTPLHLAAAAYELGIVARLLSSGARVDAKNRRGAEPLHYAADGAPGAPSWNPEAQFAVVEGLIQAGAEPNALDRSGVAPLHRAVRTRCASAVRALLANHADVHLKNESGSTALHLAVQNSGRGGSGSTTAREQQVQIIGLLLAYGARGSDEDANGTAVTARVRSAWVAALLAKGVDRDR